MANKLAKLQRFLPGLYQPQTNTYVKGLLYAWAGEDDLISQEIINAKDQLFVQGASLQYLDALGSNVGVFRPTSFNLQDDQFRELIPALSFDPKQVLPTILRVLGVFFGTNNPLTKVYEINPNEIVIQIPSSVPALRKTLRGSHHFHNYSGTITAIDNIGKTMTVDVDGDLKQLRADELAGAEIGQDLDVLTILSNTVGNVGVTLQFAASANLAVFSTGHYEIANVFKYPGSFMPDLTRTYTVQRLRGVLGQNIVAGNVYPVLIMNDASQIPDSPGLLIFNFGFGTQETAIQYFGRPNNTTLTIDPSYTFLSDHSIGEAVNVMVTPYITPDINGTDYSVYLTGVEAARTVAQSIIQSILAAGIVIRWIVTEPIC